MRKGFNMKYQLVVQFEENLISYEELIKLENLLIEQLHDSSEIDGHDVGSGEINIFILTNDPEVLFERIKSLLPENIIKKSKIAYREVAKEEYSILWPSSLKKFRIV